MSRRGGGNHPENRRSQPSPAHSQQSSINAAGSGRGGGGRGSRGGRTSNPSSSGHPPPPSYAPAPVTSPPSVVAAPVVRPSVSAPFVPSVAAPIASLSSTLISIESLTAEVKQKATLESAPSSQKAVRFHNRPGYGQLGRKI